MQNAEKPYTEFPFNIKKMSTSGCLFDFDKLNDVSKNIISRMEAKDVTEKVTAWALANDPAFGAALSADPAYAESIFAIGRGGAKPRKDLETWADAKPYMGFFYDEYFTVEDSYPENFEKKDIVTALEKFLENYDPADDSTVWFNKIKEIAPEIGFAPEMKLYKKDPAAYRGHVGDVSMFLRIAVTGKMNSPDMYSVMQILGRERVAARIRNMIESL